MKVVLKVTKIFTQSSCFLAVFFAVLKHRYLRGFVAWHQTLKKHMPFVHKSQTNQVKSRVFRCFRRVAKTSLFAVVWRHQENAEKHMQFVNICLHLNKSHVFSRVLLAVLTH